ncbi:MAG: hypothetical protein RLZZ602_1336 [Pseudomonadota bacterium]|jgi:hypothetical protein
MAIIGFDGFDKAVIGIGQVTTERGKEEFLVYDRHKMIKIVQVEHNLSYEEAYQYVTFNFTGVFLGVVGPCLVDTIGNILPHENDVVH